MRPHIRLIIALILMQSPLFAQDLAPNLRTGFNTIQPMEVYNLCKEIASDKYQGRLTGHEGYTKAANWAAAKFKKWGLKPIEGESYLQSYPSPYTLIDDAAMTLYIAGKETVDTLHLEFGTDFIPLSYADTGDYTAGLVFAGWGISAPDLDYDDYDGIDVKGKFVLTFRGTPDRERREFTDFDQHRKRMETAHQRGALGLIYIYPKPYANPNGDWIKGFTPGKILEAVADKLFAEKGLTATALKEKLQTSKQPHSFALESSMHYRVQSRHFPKGVGYNIAGFVEGSDPEFKDECVVFGAHYDHCGFIMDKVYPGANDDASGSAVVMALGKAFAQSVLKPKRSVLFVLFGGEEMGVLGSKYFADHFPAQFTKIDGMLNYDMVGEGDGASCGYSSNAVELKALLEESDQHVRTLRRMREIRHIGVRSGDFGSFFEKGAPCLSFYSNGPHLFYHQTGDTIYRINPEIMADIARLGFLCGYQWADR